MAQKDLMVSYPKPDWVFKKRKRKTTHTTICKIERRPGALYSSYMDQESEPAYFSLSPPNTQKTKDSNRIGKGTLRTPYLLCTKTPNDIVYCWLQPKKCIVIKPERQKEAD
jgi:hypothetical protein